MPSRDAGAGARHDAGPSPGRTAMIAEPLPSTYTPMQAVGAFLSATAAAGRTRSTIGFYREKLTHFCHFLEGEGVEDVGQLSQAHTRAYMQDHLNSGRTSGGIHAHARSVRTFLNWCADEDPPLIAERVARKFKMPPLEQKEIQPFSTEQVQALLSVARARGSYLQSCRDVAMFYVLLDTGMRVSELVGLTLEDIKPSQLRIGRSKNHTGRLVPISPATVESIKAYLKERVYLTDTHLFLARGGDPMTTQAVRELVRRLGEEAGISNAHPHRFRHTCATQWIANGGHPMLLQRLLGHKTGQMVQRYVKVADESVLMAHRQHSLIARILSMPADMRPTVEVESVKEAAQP